MKEDPELQNLIKDLAKELQDTPTTPGPTVTATLQTEAFGETPGPKATSPSGPMPMSTSKHTTPAGTQPSKARILPTPCRLDFGADELKDNRPDQDTRWWSEQPGWEANWWGRDSWGQAGWKRSWSGTEWDRAWGWQPEKKWECNRGPSKDLSFEQHPGWGQDAATEAQHAENALQRAPTSVEEQHKPSSDMAHEAPGEAVQEAAPITAPEEAVQEAAPITAPEKAIQEAAPITAPEEAVQEAAPITAPEKAVEAAPITAPEEAVQEAAPITAPQKAIQEAAPITAPEKAVQEAAPITAPTEPAKRAAAAACADDADADKWRKNKKGEYITPHALYMRFYRSIRGGVQHAASE